MTLDCRNTPSLPDLEEDDDDNNRPEVYTFLEFVE